MGRLSRPGGRNPPYASRISPAPNNRPCNVELTTTSREPGVRRYAKKVAKKALSREKKLERFLEFG